MEASRTSLLSVLLAGVLMGFMSTSGAYDFSVGGGSGWVQSPSESYGDWAERNRFQVGDTLVFKYKKGDDSVLVVTKEAYDSCNVSDPIQKLDGGDSVFKLDRSGAFYFISGAAGHCGKGEKLVVVVLAVRGTKPSPPPASSQPSLPPSPSASPKPPTSPAPSPSSSSAPSPSSSVASPSPSPSPSHAKSPSPSPSPSSFRSPSPSPSRSSPSPSPAAATTAPAPAAAAVSPTQSPTSGSPPPGASGTGSAPAPSPSTPSSSSSVLTASWVSFGLLALVLGCAYLG